MPFRALSRLFRRIRSPIVGTADPKLTDELRAQAKLDPNSNIYVIDPSFDPDGDVPFDAIVGYWPINGEGEIRSEFIPNPAYIRRF